MANVPVPLTVEEFEIALGKAIAAQMASHTSSDRQLEELIENLPDEAHIKVAQAWISNHKTAITALSGIVADALAQSGGDCMTILMGLQSSPDVVRYFIAKAQPQYFREMFIAGTKQEGQPLLDFADLLGRLCR
jgi:hypothetical protein